MQAVLSIAGSDPSGGAGIQADIKTIAAHRLYGETVITALTAQNTMGVYGIEDVSPEFVKQQIDAVFSDIRPAAVKIGMVSSVSIIETIAEGLTRWDADNVVLDPVMVSTTGGSLISDEAIEALKAILIPLADIITPNLPEAEALAGFEFYSEKDMERAAFQMSKVSKGAVMIKGGHSIHAADDVLVSDGGTITWMREGRVETENTHGTGCSLSSAIACNLALGFDMIHSVRKAKEYITGALQDGLNLGQGTGPLNHMWEYREI